jgi:hypothetical protein
MSRGKPKPKLRDLSEQPLTIEEQDALIDAIIVVTPPIVVAILGAVLVEHELESSLRRKLPRKDDETWRDMLDERGPFSTFSRKIMAGHAMRIYDEAFQTNLDIIRVIRNAFAHSKRVIDFNHPLVIAQLRRIAIPSFKKKRFKQLQKSEEGLETYRSLCILSATWLIKRENKSRAAANKRPRKPKELASFYDALTPSLGLANLGKGQEGGSKSHPLLFPPSRSGGPNPPVQGGLLDALTSYSGSKADKS